ncbi:MAG TPA: hypothetical protein VF251_07915 [Pyrinomonadaceae bacterium]
MVELYFLLYRIPVMMSKAARERHRSALAWSLIAIGLWLFTEFAVAVALGLAYAVGTVVFDWPEQFPAGFRILAYFVSLAAAIVSVTLLRRRLLATPSPSLYSSPPPPPTFS